MSSKIKCVLLVVKSRGKEYTLEYNPGLQTWYVFEATCTRPSAVSRYPVDNEVDSPLADHTDAMADTAKCLVKLLMKGEG